MFSARIVPGYPFSEYIVEPKELSAEYSSLIDSVLQLCRRDTSPKDFCSALGVSDAVSSFDEFVDSLDQTKFGKPVGENEKGVFIERLEALLSKIVSNADVQKTAASEVYSKLHGYLLLQPLFEDDELEEIMINGTASVFVLHKKNGVCKTNLRFENGDLLKQFVMQISSDFSLPFEDLKLPEGSRANVLFPPVCEETTITIRKVRNQQLSIVDLINLNTISVDLAAFLWMCIEGMRLYPLNILIVGGTASGKTTTLNALSSFIPPSDRIVSIEDTPEISLLGMQNWVPCRTTDRMSAEALLKNSLRMRPDRIIVGEVRGKEAQTLFTAMNVGHRGMLATLHAEDAKDTISRLQNFPMNIPVSLVPLVNLVVVQHNLNTKKGLLRRVMQVSELSKIENLVAFNEIYAYDSQKGIALETGTPAQSKERIAKAAGVTINSLTEEIAQRKKLLNYLVEKNITKLEDVNAFMRNYYSKVYSGK